MRTAYSSVSQTSLVTLLARRSGTAGSRPALSRARRARAIAKPVTGTFLGAPPPSLSARSRPSGTFAATSDGPRPHECSVLVTLWAAQLPPVREAGLLHH